MNDILTDGINIEKINSLGDDINEKINNDISNILINVKALKAGTIGDELTKLAVKANKITKKASSLSEFKVLRNLQYRLGRYKKIDSQLHSIIDGISYKKNELDNSLNQALLVYKTLEESVYELDKVINELDKFSETVDKDDFILSQTVVSKQKSLKVQSTSYKQSLESLKLIIIENREVYYQLDDACKNIFPLFKVSLINALNLKIQKDALQVKKNLIEATNNLIVKNAKSISELTDDLIKGREQPLISVKSLQEANNILQDSIKRINESANNSIINDKEVIQSLDNLSKEITNVKNFVNVKELEVANK